MGEQGARNMPHIHCKVGSYIRGKGGRGREENAKGCEKGRGNGRGKGELSRGQGEGPVMDAQNECPQVGAFYSAARSKDD